MRKILINLLGGLTADQAARCVVAFVVKEIQSRSDKIIKRRFEQRDKTMEGQVKGLSKKIAKLEEHLAYVTNTKDAIIASLSPSMVKKLTKSGILTP